MIWDQHVQVISLRNVFKAWNLFFVSIVDPKMQILYEIVAMSSNPENVDFQLETRSSFWFSLTTRHFLFWGVWNTFVAKTDSKHAYEQIWSQSSKLLKEIRSFVWTAKFCDVSAFYGCDKLYKNHNLTFEEWFEVSMSKSLLCETFSKRAIWFSYPMIIQK